MFNRIPEPPLMEDPAQCEFYNQEFEDDPDCLPRFIATYKKYVGIHDGTVIDLGSGTCNFVVELCRVYPKLNFVCYEASDAMISLAKQNIANSGFENRIAIVKDDFFNATGNFNVVIANRVLHHVNDTENFWKLASNLSDNVLVCDLERPQQLSYIEPEFPEDLKNSFMAAYTVDEVAEQIKSYNYTVSREEHQGGLCTYTVFTKKDIKFRF
jgi:2-polyprenyl-3-methyl-5-hydroxy-6-metoxy-1,4-benzoquinol methylase